MRDQAGIAVFELAAIGGLFSGIVHHPWIFLVAVLIGVMCRVAANMTAAKQQQERRRRLAQSPLPVVDRMSGVLFEQYVATRLRDAGFPVQTTPASGDFGVDLIISNSGRRVAVQCKRLSRSVGVAAVQQVVAGARHYGCDTAMVISNQEYTPAARELAHTHDCSLVGRSALATWDTISAVRDELTYVIGQPVRGTAPTLGKSAAGRYSIQRPQATNHEVSPARKVAARPAPPTSPIEPTTTPRAYAQDGPPLTVEPPGGAVLNHLEVRADEAARRAEAHLDEVNDRKSTFERGDTTDFLNETLRELGEAEEVLAEVAGLLRALKDEVPVDPAVDISWFTDPLGQVEAKADEAARRAKDHLDVCNSHTNPVATALVGTPRELRKAAATLTEIGAALRALKNKVADQP